MSPFHTHETDYDPSACLPSMHSKFVVVMSMPHPQKPYGIRNQRLYGSPHRCPQARTGQQASALSGRSIKDTEVSPPGTDLFRVHLCHHASNLGNVIEIMNSPRREELAQTHQSEFGVATRPIQLRDRQLPVTYDLQVSAPQLAEPIEAPGQRPTLKTGELREPIKWLEGLIDAHPDVFESVRGSTPCSRMARARGIQSVSSPWIR